MLSDITQKQLKDILHYDPDIGIFRWIESRRGRVNKGDIAGSLNSKKYILIGINNKRYLAHRLAWLYMTGEWPNEIDHKDRCRSNNAFLNLENGTHGKNMKNSPMKKTNRSGFTGVFWSKRDGKWLANIRVTGKNIYLGVFSDKSSAISAREKANIKYGFHANHGLSE